MAKKKPYNWEMTIEYKHDDLWKPADFIGHAPDPAWKRRLRRVRLLRRLVPAPELRRALSSDVPVGIWTGETLALQGMIAMSPPVRLTRWQRLRKWWRKRR